VIEGYLWGRGALDMKGGVAMLVTAFLRAKAENLPLPGDVILCVVSDEEAGGEMGARFLVEEHPELFAGVRYALGEFGAFSLYLGGRRFYPIMVAEKQVCWMKATVRGPAGHASMPIRGGAMSKAASLLQALDRQALPVHITPAVRLMLETMASNLEEPARQQILDLLDPTTTDAALEAIGEHARFFGPLLRNTVSPTVIRGGTKTNVIPGEVSVELDGRLLPGYAPEHLLTELRSLLGSEVELEITRYDPGVSESNMDLFETLGRVLQNADPEGIPIPLVFPAVTDGRFFSRIGIQTYGFLPMTLPQDFNFIETIHAANERIPVNALDFGADAVYQVLQRFGA
jgi:acetylornithine deacetylase/succinyl-diaminopimelate desuccinylase-like protein